MKFSSVLPFLGHSTNHTRSFHDGITVITSFSIVIHFSTLHAFD